MRLQSLAAAGSRFVAHYVPSATEPGLKDYDEAFCAWQLDKSPPFTEQQVTEAIGGYLGNKCVAGFEMEWVVVTDEIGTDYAIRSKKVELISFPFSAVFKRTENQERDFVHGVYYAVKDMATNGEAKAR